MDLPASRLAARILLVDDNLADVRIIRMALAEAGDWVTQIAVLHDGDDAIAYLQRAAASAQLPDLLVLDLNLPRCPGTEVLRFIQREGAMWQVRVAILSSSPEDVIEREVADAGVKADCCFTKPSNLDAFLALGQELRRCAERSLVRDELPL